MQWDELSKVAPRTKAVWEEIGNAKIHPVLESVPRWLVSETVDQRSPNWGDFLEAVAETGITNRERLLRYLITRSVVDQGSDIGGVEQWHRTTFERVYDLGLPVFDDPKLFVSHYSEILDIADECRAEVIEEHAQRWADGATTRHAANYTPFMVDGQRGKGNTHWFLSARVFPTLLLSQIRPGGLTELVFGKTGQESPREMSRRLRNDPNDKEGLGWVMGDKACDLFAKWAIGSFRLTEGLDSEWGPADCPIPMDQRIGRLMIRCGFMDEFYGVVSEMSIASHGFTPRDNQDRPNIDDSVIPPGPWHLTVMNFRRQATVRNATVIQWIGNALDELGRSDNDFESRPQDVISLLCRTFNFKHGRTLTPVEVDDYFMEIGGGPCKDQSPECTECPLETTCQANVDESMTSLKNCFT